MSIVVDLSQLIAEGFSLSLFVRLFISLIFKLLVAFFYVDHVYIYIENFFYHASFSDLQFDEQIIILPHFTSWRLWESYHSAKRIRLNNSDRKVSTDVLDNIKPFYFVVNNPKFQSLCVESPLSGFLTHCFSQTPFKPQYYQRKQNVTVEVLDYIPVQKGDLRATACKVTDLKDKDPLLFNVQVAVGNKDSSCQYTMIVSMAMVKEFMQMPKAVSPTEDIKTIESKIIHNLAGMNYINIPAQLNSTHRIVLSTFHFIRYLIISNRQAESHSLPSSGGFEFPMY
jgi:hypothetical protein